MHSDFHTTPQKGNVSATDTRPYLPGSRLLIVLSIISLALPGLIGGGISAAVLILAKRRSTEYSKKPSRWNKFSQERIRTARTLAIISACFSALVIFIVLVYVIVDWPTLQNYF
ncbi:MAG: hypothetical protein ACK5Z2_14785 [Bacteroidota bacterium]|jgi:hypothetical protein